MIYDRTGATAIFTLQSVTGTEARHTGSSGMTPFYMFILYILHLSALS